MVEPKPVKIVSPTISTIVPTYNRARFLGRALDSILNQSLPSTEVIVVDDGSSDGTPAILESFSTRVKVIRKPNGGKASALNMGLSAASGELIWVFDDDDIALPNALESLASALVAHPECGFAFGAYAPFVTTEDSEPTPSPARLFIDRSLDFQLSVLERCYIFQPAMLVRRTCYDAVGRFDESLLRSQDYEMLIRLSRAFRGVDVGCVVFYQRRHAGLRGTANAPVAGRKKDAGWITYDRLIFSRIYTQYPLAAFLPGGSETVAELSVPQHRAALLERCCIMARKGMWEVAAADLRSFCALVQSDADGRFTRAERATLKRFFGPYSYADHTLPEAGLFFAAWKENMSRRLRWTMALLLSSPWRVEILYCIRNFHVRYFLGTVRKLTIFTLLLARTGRSPIALLNGIEHE